MKRTILLFGVFLSWAFSSQAQDNRTSDDGLILEPYKPMYFLQTWSTSETPLGISDKNYPEWDFQISFKKELIGFKSLNFYFGYTQRSFWQFFDFGNSSYFRDNNYNPEIFALLDLDCTLEFIQLGLEHESNGERNRYINQEEEENYSRSWNRVYLETKFAWDNSFWLQPKLWHVLGKDSGSFPKDNPDIQDYLGNGELRLGYGEKYRFGMMLRNAEAGATYQMDFKTEIHQCWSAISPGLDFQLYVFNGYGENLLNYNEKILRYGLGLGIN